MYEEQNKKRREIRIVKGFFKTLNVKADFKPFENPDTLAIFKSPDSDVTRIVGIEVRAHFNDEIPQESFSQGQRLLSFWQKVQEEIEKLKFDYPQLQKIHAFFQLNKDDLLKTRLNSKMKKDLADELVQLVLKESQDSHSDILIVPEWEGKGRIIVDFTGYPLMKKYVDRVIIRKDFYGMWSADGRACYVGVNIEYLCKIIMEKNLKAQKYDRNGLDELWLLIAAPHDNPFNAMHRFPEWIDFRNQKIIETCSKTPFDKIFFWSSPPHEWYKRIWPKEDQI